MRPTWRHGRRRHTPQGFEEAPEWPPSSPTPPASTPGPRSPTTSRSARTASSAPTSRIGRGTRLIGHVCVYGRDDRSASTTSSARSPSSAATRRTSPTRGRPTRVEIGDHNIIREGVTINRATEKEDGVTRVGSHNFLMADVARRPRLQARRPDHDRQRLDARRPRPRRVAREHLRRRRRSTTTSTIGGYSFVGGQSRIYHDVPRVHARRRQPVEGPLHQRRRPEAQRHQRRGDRRRCTRPTA